MSTPVAEDPRIGVSHNRALCCDCGSMRLFSNNAGLRNPVTAAVTDADIAHHRPLRPHLWAGKVAWERWLADFKCASCKRVTRHALLRDCAEPKYRDREEAEDHALSRPAKDPDEQRFHDEVVRVQGFGVKIEFRDGTARIVSGQVHYYDIERRDKDKTFLIRLNPNLPWTLLLKGLDSAWSTISNRTRCELENWTQRKGRRTAYFSVSERVLSAAIEGSTSEIDRWATLWAQTEVGR